MKHFIVISFCVLFSCSLFAQPGKGYAQDAAEKKYGEPGKDKLDGWMANVANAKTEAAYDFPLYISMHITSYKNDDKKESDIQYYINGAQNTVGFKATDDNNKKRKDEMFMIYDHKNHSMVMLNEKEKSAMAMNLNAFMSGDAIKRRDEGKGEAPKNDMKCNKTGKSKTILGYKCEEYVCIDEDRNRKSEIWVTTRLKTSGLSQASASNPWAAYFGNAEKMGGMMMEGNFYKNEHIESSIVVTEINEKSDKSVKMSDYTMKQSFR